MVRRHFQSFAPRMQLVFSIPARITQYFEIIILLSTKQLVGNLRTFIHNQEKQATFNQAFSKSQDFPLVQFSGLIFISWIKVGNLCYVLCILQEIFMRKHVLLCSVSLPIRSLWTDWKWTFSSGKFSHVDLTKFWTCRQPSKQQNKIPPGRTPKILDLCPEMGQNWMPANVDQNSSSNWV